MLSETNESQGPPVAIFHLREMSKLGKSRVQVYWWLPMAGGAGEVWRVTDNGSRVSFGGDENILKLIMVMVTPQYTKIY